LLLPNPVTAFKFIGYVSDIDADVDEEDEDFEDEQSFESEGPEQKCRRTLEVPA
jgi:hypothetical protein